MPSDTGLEQPLTRLPSHSAQHLTTFEREGYLGPIRVFTTAECVHIADYLHRDGHPGPVDWPKSRAVHERFVFDLATQPLLLRILTQLLGDNVVLWGASTVVRRPGAVHPWHSDIESCHPEGRFVSVWIGIEHTSQESALQVITGSHRLGMTVQQARAARGLPREQGTGEAILAVAREYTPGAELMQPEMTNGDALFFDGRLWHGSDNSRKQGRRMALLLQYAAADNPVRIPDLTQLDWPFRLRQAPRPSVIVVAGRASPEANRLVPAPPPLSKGVPMVATVIHRFTLPLGTSGEPWARFPAFKGPTCTLSAMGCHASVLAAGHTPHPPHAHREEELLVPLHGAVEAVIAKAPDDSDPRVERLEPGSFIYYPAWQHHTVRNPERGSSGYLMFKWHGPEGAARDPLNTGIFHHHVEPPPGAKPFWTARLLQGPTRYLGKLRSHVTVLQPGAGYEPHVDAYDVAILLLEGTVETLGECVDPLGVIYYAAGEPHGMRNVGSAPARYLVFEFHGPGAAAPVPLDSPTLADALRRLKRELTARLPGFRRP
jgi:mannose-6-phosphate isomerase-like protein (cupin superfamily)